MSNFQAINIEYLRASRTIETVLVTKENSSKVFFIYNYEGNSFRVFQSQMNLIHFFLNKTESDFHFNSEIELDHFLSEVNIST